MKTNEPDLHRMSPGQPAATCPDCDDPLALAFRSTSGVGAHKRGDAFNTTPDTTHYVCFPCGRAWKRRLDGPLTPDVVGDLTFFSCRDQACGAALSVDGESSVPADVQLVCAHGHRHAVTVVDGDLTLRLVG